jgi:hypothetical protein
MWGVKKLCIMQCLRGYWFDIRIFSIFHKYLKTSHLRKTNLMTQHLIINIFYDTHQNNDLSANIECF